MEEREIYPNPPLVLVAFEIRHPAAGEMPANVLAAVKRELAAEVPLRRDATLVNVQVQAGAGGQSHMETETAPKFVSRDSTTAVTYRQAAIIVETTKYQRYERVRELVSLAVQARQAVSPIDGVDRIGLRYVNEVRVPGVDADDSPMAWGSWLDSSLLGPLQAADDLKLKPRRLHGFAQFEVTQDQSLALRFGPLDGYAVNPEGDLKRTTTPPGPFFLIDIDSFWTSSGETPQPDLAHILESCDTLHVPVRELFERLITDRLREEVLRHGA
jgi:uncharacterized protein (TIGR04255 family)